jgi:hypothetical protein
MTRKQRGMLIDATVIGLLATYLIWGLRGLAVVAAIVVAYVVLLGGCIIDCTIGPNYAAIATAIVLRVAVVYPRQFLIACGMVPYGILRAAVMIIL